MSHLVRRFGNHVYCSFVNGTAADHPYTASPLCYKYWCPPAKKIFCLQRKTLDPSWKRISGLNEVCTLASFDTLLEFLLADTKLQSLWAYLRKMFELEGVCWSPTLSDKCRGLSVDSACEKMSNGLLDLIIVGTFYIWLFLFVFCQNISLWHVFYKPVHTIFIHAHLHTNPPACIANTYRHCASICWTHTLCTHATLMY